MCIDCHGPPKNSDVSTESEIQWWQEQLGDPQFEKWNTTSLNFTVMAMLNLDGKEVQKIAKELYGKFLDWAKTQENFGKKEPKYGSEPFPTVDKLILLQEEIEKVNETAASIGQKIYHESFLEQLYKKALIDV